MQYIVSLGAGEEQVFGIKTAISSGLKVIAFDIKECDYNIVKPDIFYQVSIHEKEKIAEILKQYDICGVLPSPVGRNITTVGYLNDYFGLKGPSFYACDTCSDKLKNNQYLEKINLPFPKIYDIDNIVFPALLKPRFGSGSRNVQIVYNKKEFEDIYNSYDNSYGEYLIQEYIQGVEYGCDIILRDGNIDLINIRSKQLTQEPFRQETAYMMPADISHTDFNIIKNTLSAYILNLNVQDAVFNADIILSDDKAYIIDISPRAAGLNILSKFVVLCYGFNIYEYYINILLNKPNKPVTIPKDKYALLEYITYENITINKTVDIKKLREKYNILYIESNIMEGTFMSKIVNSFDVLKRGYYIIESNSLDELSKRNNDILNELTGGNNESIRY